MNLHNMSAMPYEQTSCINITVDIKSLSIPNILIMNNDHYFIPGSLGSLLNIIIVNIKKGTLLYLKLNNNT